MSVKGSEPRTLNRDAAKYRSNLDSIKQDTRQPSNGYEVPKDKLPVGFKFRKIYGDSK